MIELPTEHESKEERLVAIKCEKDGESFYFKGLRRDTCSIGMDLVQSLKYARLMNRDETKDFVSRILDDDYSVSLVEVVKITNIDINVTLHLV